MKRVILWTILLILLIPLCLGPPRCFGYLKTTPPPPFDPNTITFEYDPNQVNWPIFCAKVLYVGEEDTIALDYYDPQGDPITVTLLQGPPWATITGEGTDWFLILKPAQAGTYYLDLQWEDIPKRGLPISAERTMLLKVQENGGPQPWPCGGSTTAMTKRQAFQVAKKGQRTEAMNALARGKNYIVLSHD